MNESAHRRALEQIRAIADEALKGSSVPKASRQSAAKMPTTGAQAESLPDHILELRGEKFFAQPKTFNEVHVKLQPSYPCDVDRVKVACMRLQKRKLLRKTSKLVGKKNQVAYVW